MNKISIILISLSFLFTSSGSANIVDVEVDGKIYQAREGEFLVKYKKGRAHSNNSIRTQSFTGVNVIRRFAYPEDLELVKINPGVNAINSMSTFRNNSDVLYVEPNYVWHATDIPNDTYFSYQWGLYNEGQNGGTANADINILPAWDLTTGEKSVVLGVIDTGVDYLHPDLANNMWVNSLEIPNNGIDDDGNGFIDDIHGINAINHSGDPMDDNMHGTHVAGIMAAEHNNSIGVAGVAPNVSIAACKFLDASGSGDTASAIVCLNYFRDLTLRSEDPVRVVATNNSWAGGPYSQALYDAIKEHQDEGILFVAAASNEGQNNDRVNTYPANYFLSNVISVAATDRNDRLATFSNYGKVSVDVAAPGVDIASTIPSNQYASLSGTSMAAPYVAGLAGLIASFDDTLPWYGIKNLILTSGEATDGASYTLSGRRILAIGTNGYGALSCQDKGLVKRKLPRASSITLNVGQSVKLAILSVNCDKTTRSTSSADGDGARRKIIMD